MSFKFEGRFTDLKAANRALAGQDDIEDAIKLIISRAIDAIALERMDANQLYINAWGNFHEESPVQTQPKKQVFEANGKTPKLDSEEKEIWEDDGPPVLSYGPSARTELHIIVEPTPR